MRNYLEETITFTSGTSAYHGDEKLIINPGEQQVYIRNAESDEKHMTTEVVFNACPIYLNWQYDTETDRYLFCSEWVGEAINGVLEFDQVTLTKMVSFLKNQSGFCLNKARCVDVVNMIIQCFIRHGLMKSISWGVVS